MNSAAMRFRLEQIFLTDGDGQVIPAGTSVDFHVVEAVSVEQALQSFVKSDGAAVMGDILKLPGLQAVATARRENSVYTLQVVPASDIIPR